jgi:signal transduction histidine kinase
MRGLVRHSCAEAGCLIYCAGACAPGAARIKLPSRADLHSRHGETTSLAEHAEFSAILKNEVKRINATVSEFLEFARPKRTELRRLNLSDATRTCLRQIEARVRALGMTLATAIADQVIVNGTPEKLHQMMLNLLLNAMHASSEGQSIDVSLERSANSKADELAPGGEPARRRRQRAISIATGVGNDGVRVH